MKFKTKQKYDGKIPSVSLSQKEILTMGEAVIYLRISKSYLYKLTSGKEITFFKPKGKLIYFKKEDLDNWMLQNESVGIARLENDIDNYLNRRQNGGK